tara:strand:- start:503 stop:712 length:210 start_codon:yes stop_codon:yes gene_type:complete
MISLIEQHQLDYFIGKNPSWIIDNKAINKEFKFDNFIDAFGFMTKVALLSEKWIIIQIGRIHIIKLRSS